MTCCPMIVPLTVAVQDEIALSVEDGLCVGLDVDIAFNGRAPDIYQGPYEVVPDENEHLLPTSGKTLERDIRVYEVPFALADRSAIDRMF